MKSDFQRNVERMLGAIRYGNEADAFLYTRMVARFIFSKKPNLRLPDGSNPCAAGPIWAMIEQG